MYIEYTPNILLYLIKSFISTTLFYEQVLYPLHYLSNSNLISLGLVTLVEVYIYKKKVFGILNLYCFVLKVVN